MNLRRTIYRISEPKYLEAAIVLAGLLGLLIAIVDPNPYTLVIPPALLFGVFLSRIPSSGTIRFQNESVSKIICITMCVGLSILLISYVRLGHTRPLSIHLLTAGLYGLCGILAFFNPKISLVFTLAVSLIHRATVYYASAAPIGRDSLFHQRMMEAVWTMGSIEPFATELSKYYHAPFSHLFAVAGIDVAGVSVRAGAFLTIGVLAAITPGLIIYSLAARYWTSVAGALAAILFVSSDFAINLGTRPRPLSMGIVTFSIIFFALMYHLNRTDTRFSFIIIGIFASHVLTDQFSSFTILVAITTICGVYFLASRRKVISAIYIPVLTGLILALSWLYTYHRGPLGDESSFLIVLSARLIYRVATSGSRSAIYPSSEYYVPAGADALNSIHILPAGSLFLFVVAGALTCRYRREISSEIPMALLLSTGVMAAFAFGGPVVGIDLLQPFRWFAFFYLPAIALTSAYLSRVDLPFSRSQAIGAIFVVFFISTFAFAAGANFAGAPDDPKFGSPGAERYAISPTEAAGMEFVVRYQGQSTIVADEMAWQLTERHYGGDAEVYRFERYGDPPANERPLLAIHRNYSKSDQAAWNIRGERGNLLQVHGPIEKPRGSQIYNAGDLQAVHQ